MRKSSIRKMTHRPVTRKGAKLHAEITSIAKRMKSWLQEVESNEIDSNALANGAKIWLALQPTQEALQMEMETYLFKDLSIKPLSDLAMANLATHTIDWIFGVAQRNAALSRKRLIEKKPAVQHDPFCGIDIGEEHP